MINTAALYRLLDFEPYIILCGLMALSWFFYKIFLPNVSEERHRNLKSHFRNVSRHFISLTVLFVVYLLFREFPEGSQMLRVLPYLGFAVLVSGMVVLVKSCRLIILQYLFLGSMKHGVPILIVNIFSLILSLVLLMWTAAFVFNLALTPLLATSAAFSVILGLALQDTMGNLFAGISLQVDKAFDIGDWLEVTNGSVKTVGQVKEITWRATVLVGWTEELIILPNRTLANSQIANFSIGDQPIIRSQTFTLKYDSDPQLVKQCLLQSLKNIKMVRTWPEPLVIITEMTPSWMSFKLIYYIESYGSQFIVGDEVIESALSHLTTAGFEIAPPRMTVDVGSRNVALQ